MKIKINNMIKAKPSRCLAHSKYLYLYYKKMFYICIISKHWWNNCCIPIIRPYSRNKEMKVEISALEFQILTVDTGK